MPKLTISDDEIEAFLSLKKTAPISRFFESIREIDFSYEMSSGVIVHENGTQFYKKGVTVSLLCRASKKLNRNLYRFSLFLLKDGVRNRVYQLDTADYGLGMKSDHDWPHEHLGSKRFNLDENFPNNFHAALIHFCKKTNIEFEEEIKSPFELTLK